MHYITFVLLFVTWAGFAYLFLIIKKSYIFGNCKGIFIPKEKWLTLRLKEVPHPLHLNPSFSEHWDRRGVWINEKTKLLTLIIWNSTSDILL